MTRDVLIDRLGPAGGAGLHAKRAALVLGGILALAALAKVNVPLWPSPVPIAMTTFGVLLIGAAYGPGLGLATVLGYLAVGALGFDVFTGTSAETGGLAYMMGGTGGYLVGYALAAALLGAWARRGWDRSPLPLAAGMLAASAAIYAPGLLWLRGFAEGWSQTLAWGLTPFLVGDALKAALAALLLPAAWRLVGAARR